MMIDGVNEEAFSEFEAVFATLELNRCCDVLVRAGLRSFFEPTLRSSRDLSASHQLIVCKLLIRCIAALRAKPSQLKKTARDVLKNTRLDVGKLIVKNASFDVANALKSSKRDAMLTTIEGLSTGFSNEARERQFLSSTIPTSNRKDAYRIVARLCAQEALRDCLDDDTDVFKTPLWSTDDTWRQHVPNNPAFETFRRGVAFEFWRRWYQRFLDGRPLDWELQSQVALIDDAVWEAGPEAVAKAIREIEADFAGPAPLKENLLRKHVEYLLKNPLLSEANALNGAETIEGAISEYLREARANCLPEDLKHLEALPQHFKAIARVIGTQTSNEQKAAQLAVEISKLHARVAELEKELAVAKSKELKGIISQEAAKSFGKTIGSPLFWGGAAVSVGYFFGVSPGDMTLENFRNYVEELLRANAETAPTAQPPLPSGIDV